MRFVRKSYIEFLTQQSCQSDTRLKSGNCRQIYRRTPYLFRGLLEAVLQEDKGAHQKEASLKNLVDGKSGGQLCGTLETHSIENRQSVRYRDFFRKS